MLTRPSWIVVFTFDADTGPIMIFIFSYFAIVMRCYGGYGWGRSILLTVTYGILMFGFSEMLRPLHEVLNGSQSYFPAFFTLLGAGLWLRQERAHPAGRWLIGVAGVFAVSLTFRSIDQTLCGGFALGTHWLWHLMNSVVLGTLIVALIRHGAPRSVLEDARTAN